MIITNVIDFHGCLFHIGLLAELRGTEALLTLQSDPTSIIAYPDLQITFTSALGDHDPMIDFVGNKNISVSKRTDNTVSYWNSINQHSLRIILILISI